MSSFQKYTTKEFLDHVRICVVGAKIRKRRAVISHNDDTTPASSFTRNKLHKSNENSLEFSNVETDTTGSSASTPGQPIISAQPVLTDDLHIIYQSCSTLFQQDVQPKTEIDEETAMYVAEFKTKIATYKHLKRIRQAAWNNRAIRVK